jgi:hypothetical protein|tara:strand:- start:366 stop:527 length:162 start_codon:yes stop_codon:yes gene_type:complete
MDGFIKNLNAFTLSLGVDNAPAVVHLSLIPWPDENTRDDFIKHLTGYEMGNNY